MTTTRSERSRRVSICACARAMIRMMRGMSAAAARRNNNCSFMTAKIRNCRGASSGHDKISERVTIRDIS